MAQRKAKAPSIGFVVADDTGPLALDDYDEPSPRVLVHAIDRATIFRTRRQATAAIRRTEAYSKAQQLGWTALHRVFALYRERGRFTK